MPDLGKFFGTLFGSAAGAANPLTPAQGIVDGAEKIIGMFKLSPEVKAQFAQQLSLANLDLEKTELAGQLAEMQAQIETNQKEAESKSWFVAGWRPACGWCCALALFVQFLVAPLATWTASLLGHRIAFPDLDMATLMPLLAGMLGLGGLRTIEKIQGAAGNH